MSLCSVVAVISSNKIDISYSIFLEVYTDTKPVNISQIIFLLFNTSNINYRIFHG